MLAKYADRRDADSVNPEFPDEDELPAKGTRESTLRGWKERSFWRTVLGTLAFPAWMTFSFAFADHDPWWPVAVIWLLFLSVVLVEYRAHIGKGGRLTNLLTRRLW